MTRPHRRLVGALAFTLATTPSAQAQRASRPLLTRQEAVPMVSLLAVSAALLPVDRSLAHRLAVDPAHPGARGRTADVVAALGDPGAVLIAGGALLAGHLAHRPTLADVGLHASEALVVSGTVTQLVKIGVGRARPRTVDLDDPYRTRPFQPNAGYASFPSGHTSAAFTVATVLAEELRRRDGAAHPTRTTAASIGLYTLATGVGVARMVRRAHWASDVAAGAAVGIASGVWAVRFGHAAPPARWERWLMGTPAP